MFRPTVVSLRSQPQSSQNRLVTKLRDAQIPTYFLNCDSKFQFWKAIGKLKQVVKESQPEILQSFLFHANVIAGLTLRSFPKVDFFSGIRVADPSWTRHKLEKWATRRAQKVICVSDSVKQFAEHRMGIKPERLIAIPNGIEPESDVLNHDHTASESLPRVVFVGRLEPQKGLIPFLKFLVSQREQLPDFEMVFVGEGSQRHELEQIGRSLERIRFVGWSDDPQSWIRESQLLILPSLWEGLPNVLMEAMNLGKPVVTFGVDGVSEICGDPFQAIEPGDYPKFLQRLTQIIENKELAKSKGMQNAKRIRDHFSLKKMIADYQAIYLGNPSSPD